MYGFISKIEKSFEESKDSSWWIVSIVCFVVLSIPIAFWLGEVFR